MAVKRRGHEARGIVEFKVTETNACSCCLGDDRNDLSERSPQILLINPRPVEAIWDTLGRDDTAHGNGVRGESHGVVDKEPSGAVALVHVEADEVPIVLGARTMPLHECPFPGGEVGRELDQCGGFALCVVVLVDAVVAVLIQAENNMQQWYTTLRGGV